MATRRRYSRADKATAVIAAELSTVAAAAQTTGIPESTIRYWADSPRFAELRAKTREESASGFSVLMHLAMKRLAQLIPMMEPRDLTILLGVSAEKSQLLSGGATVRSETRSLADEFDDDEKQRLRDWIDGLPTEEPTPSAPA